MLIAVTYSWVNGARTVNQINGQSKLSLSKKAIWQLSLSTQNYLFYLQIVSFQRDIYKIISIIRMTG